MSDSEVKLRSISINPNPTLEKVREFWDNHIHDWAIARSEPGSADFFREIEEYRYEKLHYLPKLINFSDYQGQSVLDVGCGVGNDLSRFARAGASVTGIDLAPHSIDLARTNFAQRDLQGEFHVMNGEAMEFPDDQFDCVFCHTVLHFTPDPQKMIAEIFRVLRPGGTAILMTVNRKSWLNFMHRVAKVKIDHLESPVFYQFTISEFEKLLDAFQSVTIIPERFPVATKVHKGLKAKLFNMGFVGTFNALPRSWVRNSGHHLMAFARKASPDDEMDQSH
ncbi:MAG: class I SAM-dependent methyltransferase [Gammaproteobacteria bacterium]